MSAQTNRLAGILLRRIVNHEGFSRELADISTVLRCDGHHASVEGMLNLSRHHCIRGMEGRGNLSALQNDVPYETGED